MDVDLGRVRRFLEQRFAVKGFITVLWVGLTGAHAYGFPVLWHAYPLAALVLVSVLLRTSYEFDVHLSRKLKLRLTRGVSVRLGSTP